MGDLSRGVSQGRGQCPWVSQWEDVGNVEILDIIRNTVSPRESVLVTTQKWHSWLKVNWWNMKRGMCIYLRRVHKWSKRDGWPFSKNHFIWHPIDIGSRNMKN